MERIRHAPQATTGRLPLPPGGGIDAHRHDEHQIVYAGRGVLAVTTDAGSWIAPADPALWIPAGTVHEHRSYGATDLHLVGLAVADNPLRLERPAVLGVTPLLRELIIEYTARPADLGAAVGVGERTLTRLCGAELGMTFPRWRTQLRLHHALRLLAEGVPVTAVAHRCGWASSSAFIDVFRRAFGHTPGAHRALG
ncbi:AraC family transcriptional regulator [Streptomyces rugosispiralis]|uniref:Helix-turn-helix transcriptional regulator n=1 Tax=Streptomyces rugosispiralis TaxID=2967341 RepID=A0ABT1UU73_9ACTN|nr:helix-turn-helix transcriptional regulator [Streptomyces rugosispiralis]MCQ8188672.1 helix-turn-helix transcriptional regulator [Streptomyces rugosispiralis]